MSEPHVIVSAVHELNDDETVEDFWTDPTVRETVDNIQREDAHEQDWYLSEAVFESDVANKQFLVESWYHSNRGETVIEIMIEGKQDMRKIGTTGLEQIIEEINDAFERHFTLEVYYWYTATERPGGTD